MVFYRVLVFRPARQFWAVALGVIACYARHVHFLMFVRFDYGYNMMVMVAVGKTMVTI